MDVPQESRLPNLQSLHVQDALGDIACHGGHGKGAIAEIPISRDSPDYADAKRVNERRCGHLPLDSRSSARGPM